MVRFDPSGSFMRIGASPTSSQGSSPTPIRSAAALVAGHIKSKQFVARRLRFTSFVENPALGLFAGVGAEILAAPLVALVPFVGAGTTLAFGIGVGTGVAVGANRARSGDYVDSF